MASAAEQMAANLSWSTLGKATELRQRIFFTIGLLIVYRIGTYIPVPGIDAVALQQFMDEAASKPIQVLDSVPKQDTSEIRNICKAFTLSGKKCTFKAVCGDYCKKHRIDDQVLGTRPKINVSLL